MMETFMYICMHSPPHMHAHVHRERQRRRETDRVGGKGRMEEGREEEGGRVMKE